MPNQPVVTQSQWTFPAQFPTLTKGEIQLWCLDQSSPDHPWHIYKASLSETETKRAGKYRFTADRDAFIMRRGALRALLACYLGTTPQAVTFATGPYGKPDIIGSPHHKILRFNTSMSKNVALLAFTLVRPLGVDVEFIRPTDDLDQMAVRFFSPKEKRFLLSFSGERRLSAFYKIWTLKEALLKALGLGLSQGADRFGTIWNREGNIQIVDNRLDILNPDRWILKAMRHGEDWWAAVAFGAKEPVALQRFYFNPKLVSSE